MYIAQLPQYAHCPTQLEFVIAALAGVKKQSCSHIRITQYKVCRQGHSTQGWENAV